MGVMIKAILSHQFCILWRSRGPLALIVSIDIGVVCTHTHTHIHTHINTNTHTHKRAPTHASITVSGREGYWDGKRCVFRADLKANVKSE